MSITTTTADEALRNAVAGQLTWDWAFDASMIGVTAKEPERFALAAMLPHL